VKVQENWIGLKMSHEKDLLHHNLYSHVKVCPKCLGTRKLDWVEVVTGKKEPEIEFWNPPGGFTRARTLVKSLKYKPIKGGE